MVVTDIVRALIIASGAIVIKIGKVVAVAPVPIVAVTPVPLNVTAVAPSRFEPKITADWVVPR